MGFLDGLEGHVFSHARDVSKRRRETTLSTANHYYPFFLRTQETRMGQEVLKPVVPTSSDPQHLEALDF